MATFGFVPKKKCGAKKMLENYVARKGGLYHKNVLDLVVYWWIFWVPCGAVAVAKI